MKNVLVITTNYKVCDSNPYLTNDIVNQMAKKGFSVVVVGYGERAGVYKKENISEYIINVTSKLKILKYVLIWPRLIYLMLKVLRTEKSFDQVVMVAPLSVMWPAAALIRFCRIKKKTAIIFDIFPIHQMQIKALPKWIGPLAKWLECVLLSAFNDVTAMGINNKKYIENYYSSALKRSKVRVLPLWSGKKASQKNANFNSDKIRFVFGGQIIKGREIGSMISYLSNLRNRGLGLTLDIYSKGSGYKLIQQEYGALNWISFNSQIPRDEYIETLSRYQVGLIVTDGSVTLPTFPSKVIDYVTAGLATYSLVEKESDLSFLAEDSCLIYLNNFDYSEAEIEKSIAFFKGLKSISDDNLTAEIHRLRNFFSVDQAVLRLTN